MSQTILASPYTPSPRQRGKRVPQTILASLYTNPPLRAMPIWKQHISKRGFPYYEKTFYFFGAFWENFASFYMEEDGVYRIKMTKKVVLIILKKWGEMDKTASFTVDMEENYDQKKFAFFIVQYEVGALFLIDLEENYDQAGDHNVGMKEFMRMDPQVENSLVGRAS